MAFLSINTSSLNPHKPLLPISKFPNHNNPHIITTNNSLHSIKLPKTTQTPISSTLPTHLIPTHQKVSNFITKNTAKLLLGSIIFLGSLQCGPVLAKPAQAQKVVNLEEEKSGAHNDEEEEEMYEYVKLLEQEPENVENLKVLVNGKMKRGKTKEGLKYVEKLIEIEPEEVEWRLLQALCCEMMGQFSKAKRLFKDILKETPLLLRALHGLAMVMHKSHEGAAVFDMLNQALELAYREKRVTEERNIKILIAQMHLVKGDFDEASKRYQQLINENPRDFRPYLCQGILYTLLDKKKEADEQFEIYRNLVPEEFPQRGFLEDVVLAAKTESREQLEKEFKAQFSYKRKL